MDCERARTLFIGLHDGDLPDDERRALQAHLDHCEACKEEWRAYARTLDEVSNIFTLEPPEDFTLRVKQTIDRRSRGRFFGDQRFMGLSFALVSFVLILLFVLAYLFISAGKEIELVSPQGSAPTVLDRGVAEEPTQGALPVDAGNEAPRTP